MCKINKILETITIVKMCVHEWRSIYVYITRYWHICGHNRCITNKHSCVCLCLEVPDLHLRDCLREFVMNSRHPGPRREWRGVASCGPNVTLCASADPRGSPRMNSGRSFFDGRLRTWEPNARNWRSIFWPNCRIGHPKRTQGRPKGILLF